MTVSPEAARRAAAALPDLPRDAEGPVFREPWEARAFALAVALHGRGVFSWSEWAATLADEIARAQRHGDPDTGETYYHHWLATLERLVADKRVTTAETLERTRIAWDRAADRTPHGTPIELRDEDFDLPRSPSTRD
ncbi:MAG: nitrile hydratase accessory protein [Xanthobacteraceae bacterium]|nr:nitrile hydratase accessory protein [Xanthobacteraceae bacterium]